MFFSFKPKHIIKVFLYILCNNVFSTVNRFAEILAVHQNTTKMTQKPM